MVRKFLNVFFILLLCVIPFISTGENDLQKNDATKEVICNIVEYIWKIGIPVMTVVVIGAAILSIFGRMQWAALVALVVFMGVFFGASTIVTKFVPDKFKDVKDGYICTPSPSRG
ncbi:TrbC/VirB2 family protein [Wolbachia pipientis]|nr:TrbC/VirB2 family protein [Wolbachia pipientis]